MKHTKLLLLFMSAFVFCSCHNSYEAINSCPEKILTRQPPQLSSNIQFKKQIKTGSFYTCHANEYGLCINASTDLTSDDSEIFSCLHSEGNSLVLSIPKLTPSYDYNPLYTQLSDSSSFIVSDTMTIINHEILDFLNQDLPTHIMPGFYSITHSNDDILYVSLPMDPANLSSGVAVFFDNGHLIFDSFYHGFLGESPFPTATIESVNDNFLIINFPLELNMHMNEQFISELSALSALTIDYTSEIYDPIILEILDFDSPFIVESGTYFATESSNGFIVMIPFRLIR